MKFYLFKIPSKIKVFFCTKRNILFFIIVKKLPLLRNFFFYCFNTKILFVTKNKILVTGIKMFNLNKFNNNQNFFLDVNIIKHLQWFLKLKRIKIKLSLIGIGFKFFIYSNPMILQIKAGFSHSNFYKLPKNIQVFFLKSTEIIFVGNCYVTLFNLITAIKKIRLPDPYKKKGIFFKNEIIKKKQGKLS